MAEQDTTTNQTEAPQAGQTPSLEDSWREVGQHFQVLGQSLSNALKAAWNDEENQQQLKKLQDTVQGTLEQAAQSVKEAAETPEGQQIKAEVGKAAQSAQAAGQQAWNEAQPYLLTALRDLRTEVDKIIGSLEKKPPTAEPAADDVSPQI